MKKKNTGDKYYKLKMKKNDFHCHITVNATPQKAMEGILQVAKWWTKDFKGNSQKINDEFTIQHGDAHYSKHKLIEILPDKKLVWLITESDLNWLKHNKQEWTNTKTIFVLKPKDQLTIIEFTHEGLVPEMECYFRCIEGWEMVIKERLFEYLIKGIEQSV